MGQLWWRGCNSVVSLKCKTKNGFSTRRWTSIPQKHMQKLILNIFRNSLYAIAIYICISFIIYLNSAWSCVCGQICIYLCIMIQFWKMCVYRQFSALGNNKFCAYMFNAAAAAAKSLQSCLTLYNPIDGSPPGSVPGILQARILEWVAISFSNAWKWKMKVKSLSHVRLLVTPWTAAYQAPLSMRFSRQEYWSGVPLPSPILYVTIAK